MVVVLRHVTEYIGARDSSIANTFISIPKLAILCHGPTGKHLRSATRGDTKHVKTDVTIRARRGQNECGVVMLVVVLKLIEMRGSHDLFHFLRILAVAEDRGKIVASYEGSSVSVM